MNGIGTSLAAVCPSFLCIDLVHGHAGTLAGKDQRDLAADSGNRRQTGSLTTPRRLSRRLTEATVTMPMSLADFAL
jgi:hypothetical protein